MCARHVAARRMSAVVAVAVARVCRGYVGHDGYHHACFTNIPLAKYKRQCYECSHLQVRRCVVPRCPYMNAPDCEEACYECFHSGVSKLYNAWYFATKRHYAAVREHGPSPEPMVTWPQILSLYRRQNGRCAQTNVPLCAIPGMGLLHPSVDRINSKTNPYYTASNVQIVAVWYNNGKNKFTDAEMHTAFALLMFHLPRRAVAAAGGAPPLSIAVAQ